MEVIFSKSALRRKREYQIITTVVEENGKRLVKKRAATSAAVKHIENMFHNEEKLIKFFPKYIVRSSYIEGELNTPFVEGETLTQCLRTALVRSDTREILRLLKIWQQIIVGSTSNLIVENDIRKLGISNIDATSDNIILCSNGEVKCIDLEWVYDKPIELDFIIYRVLKNFSSENQDVPGLEGIFEYFSLKRDIPRYDLLLEQFTKQIFIDDNNGLEYARMGHQFMNQVIREQVKKTYTYIFPQEVLHEGDSVVVYGAGKVGREYASYVKCSSKWKFVAWLDRNAQWYRKEGMNVCTPDSILGKSFDIVLIAVAKQEIADEIMKELMEIGIAEEKIYWSKPRKM